MWTAHMSWDGMAHVSQLQFSPLLPAIHTWWCCFLLLVPLIFGVGLPSLHSGSVCWLELLALAVWKRTERVSGCCLTVVFSVCSVSWCVAPGSQVWGCCILAWCIKQSTVMCVLCKILYLQSFGGIHYVYLLVHVFVVSEYERHIVENVCGVVAKMESKGPMDVPNINTDHLSFSSVPFRKSLDATENVNRKRMSWLQWDRNVHLFANELGKSPRQQC